jgi:hypothetical protein
MTNGEWFGNMTPPDPTRMLDVLAGNVPDQHGCRCARNSRHVVVFGQPEACESPSFGVLREVHCVPIRVRNRSTCTDSGQIEN